MKDTVLLSSLVSIIFALIAGLFWAASAFVNLPVIGSGFGTISNLEPFYRAMKRVSRLNAGAAICAFISATAQSVALYISSHSQ